MLTERPPSTPQELRDKAAHALRLAEVTTDQQASNALQEFARELSAKADALAIPATNAAAASTSSTETAADSQKGTVDSSKPEDVTPAAAAQPSKPDSNAPTSTEPGIADPSKPENGNLG